MAIQPLLPRNRLLAALPPDILAQLAPTLSRVSLSHRQSLYVADQPIEAVLFFESGMASMVTQLDDGVQAEVGIIGFEGMTGTPLLHGVDSSFTDGFVQIAGQPCGWAHLHFDKSSNRTSRCDFWYCVTAKFIRRRSRKLQPAMDAMAWSSAWLGGCLWRMTA
jgi:CRP-like cAMP-binding protein